AVPDELACAPGRSFALRLGEWLPMELGRPAMHVLAPPRPSRRGQRGQAFPYALRRGPPPFPVPLPPWLTGAFPAGGAPPDGPAATGSGGESSPGAPSTPTPGPAGGSAGETSSGAPAPAGPPKEPEAQPEAGGGGPPATSTTGTSTAAPTTSAPPGSAV